MARSLNNTSPIGISGYKGVGWDKNSNKYYVVVYYKGKQITGGYYDNPTEAAYAYDDMAISIKGELAQTNYKLGLLGKDMKKEKEEYDKFNAQICDDDFTYPLNRNPMIIEFMHWLRRNPKNKGTILQFSKLFPSILKIPKIELQTTVKELEEAEILKISDGNMMFNMKTISLNHKFMNETFSQIKQKKSQQKQEKQMKQLSNLTDLTPEALKQLAKQAEELAKNKELQNEERHSLRTALNPLILNIAQTKGKYDRKLNELLDISTELDNALNALRDSLK